MHITMFLNHGLRIKYEWYSERAKTNPFVYKQHFERKIIFKIVDDFFFFKTDAFFKIFYQNLSKNALTSSVERKNLSKYRYVWKVKLT